MAVGSREYVFPMHLKYFTAAAPVLPFPITGNRNRDKEGEINCNTSNVIEMRKSDPFTAGAWMIKTGVIPIVTITMKDAMITTSMMEIEKAPTKKAFTKGITSIEGISTTTRTIGRPGSNGTGRKGPSGHLQYGNYYHEDAHLMSRFWAV